MYDLPVQGRMTLLLGSPGSGKSTLQKLLSGRLKAKRLKVWCCGQCGGDDSSMWYSTAAAAVQQDNLSASGCDAMQAGGGWCQIVCLLLLFMRPHSEGQLCTSDLLHHAT